MKPAVLRFFAIALLFSAFLVAYQMLLISPVFAAADPALCTATTAGDQYAKESIDEINKCAIKSNIFDDKIFNLNQIAGTTDSLLTVLLGYSQLHPETNELTAGTGALAASGRMVASLYAVPPVSGVNYMAEKFQKFNPVQPVYAQDSGIGFDTLKPVEKVWTAFRNMSYVAFTIVFVIIGFMIMLRSKISPQAVATVQDSLPRIVVALILVTFSYAIAGLMIDIMFLLLNVVINLLDGAGLISRANTNFVFNQSIFGLGFSLMKPVFSVVFESMVGIIEKLVKMDILNKILGFFGGGLAGIVAGIALFYVMFRVFFMLLMAYVSIVLLTIFAPFILLFQALPGNNGAKEWFKQIAANIAVFPTVALMFIMAGVLSGVSELGGNGTSGFTSGQVGHFPLLSSGLDPNDIGKLIALGFVFMTPAAAKLVKDRFGVKEGAMGAGMGAAMGALGAGAGVGAGVGKYAWGGEHSPLGRWNKTRAGVRQESIQQSVEQQAVEKGIKMRDPNTNISTYKPK